MKEGALSASAALAAFSEPYVQSRRVLVFGSSLSAAPRLLVERGARIVQVCDPNPARVEEASERLSAPGLSFTTFADEVLQARESSFDFVLVENLAAFEARAVVARAKRLLAARGVALFATPNRESTAPLLPPPEPTAAPLDYYALYDLASAEFEHVRMLGQAPFVGYAIVDFAPEGNPEPTIDSEFVPRGSEEPELFVALASRHRASVAAYAVIQLPMHRVLARTPHAPAAAPPPVLARGARTGTPDLEARLRRQEAWIAELEARAETADARADAADEQVETLEQELAALRSRAPDRTEIDRALGDERRASLALAEAESEKTRLESKLVELERAIAVREGVVAKLEAAVAERDRVIAESVRTITDRDRLIAERDRLIAERDHAIADRDAKLGELQNGAGADLADDLGALEEQLEERGREIRRLEHDLAEAERIGRALVEDLGQSRAQAGAESSETVEALGRALAASEADRVALAWCAAVGAAPTPKNPAGAG
jgi:SAM-dependent methyltransferase